MEQPLQEAWVVRFYLRQNQHTCFRVFTKFGMLLTTVQRAIWNVDVPAHPLWTTAKWQVFYVNFETETVRDVTEMILLESRIHCSTIEETATEEPNTVPHR